MIYLDNAATTRIDESVLNAMLPYLNEYYGNPQSQHDAGRAAANAVISARDRIAGVLGCSSDELYFVSGGTEAGNTALKGVCAAFGKGHLIVSAIEHPALIESAEDMEKFGFSVTFLKPDSDGVVTAESVKNAIKEDTIFCAVMCANNETGIIQPAEEIGKVCRDRGIFYYCDCVQTACAGIFPIKYSDAIGISAHKFYGPKGIGALYVGKGAKIKRLISGGMQERNFRGGTLNTAGIIGMAEALCSVYDERTVSSEKIKAVRDRFTSRVLNEIKGTHLNSAAGVPVLPSHANISFDGCGGENLLFILDLKGVCVSTGSACSAGAVAPSHVLTAMGYSAERAKSSVRFTFGKYNTAEEADAVVEILKTAVDRIREAK